MIILAASSVRRSNLTSYEIRQMLDIIRGDSNLKEKMGKIMDRDRYEDAIETRFEKLEAANKTLTERVAALESK